MPVFSKIGWRSGLINCRFKTLMIVINVMESWARAGPLACLILLSVLVDKEQASILNLSLLDLEFPVNEEKSSVLS